MISEKEMKVIDSKRERDRNEILRKNWERISKLTTLMGKSKKEEKELECRIKLHNNYSIERKEEALRVMREISKDVMKE